MSIPLMPVSRALLSILLLTTLEAPAQGTLSGISVLELPRGSVTARNGVIEGPRCASTAFQTLGQAWRVDFSTGGVVPDAGRLRKEKQTVLEPRLMTDGSDRGIFSMLTLPKSLSTRTTIIVVDNFKPTEVKVSRNAPQPGQVLRVKLQHGGLVVRHIWKLLEQDGFKADPRADIVTFRRGAQVVQLRPVEIESSGSEPLETTAIAQRVSALVRASDNEHVIVQMSLALLPCKVLREYMDLAKTRSTSTERYTFSAFIAEVVRRGTLGRAEVLEQLLHRPPTDEPLIVALNDARTLVQKKGFTFMAVASSGNYGLETSTLPAVLGNVIGVGATTWQGGPPGLPSRGAADKPEGNWSDRGDVHAVGEWFTLPPKDLSDGCATKRFWCVVSATDLKQWPQFAYRGTSFSAPSVTALLASRLQSSTCVPLAHGLADKDVDTTCF